MSEGGDEDKTEEPTGKKLDQAREEGNIPQSTEAKALASMLAAMVVVGMLAPGMVRDTRRLLIPFIEQPHTMALDVFSLRNLLIDVCLGVAKVLLVPMAVVIVMGVVFSVLQTKGFMWVPKKIAPDFKKINPISGFKRQFGPAQLIELGKQIMKLLVFGGVLFWLVGAHVREYSQLGQLEVSVILEYIHERVYWIIFTALLMVALLAVGDYMYQHWRWMEKMRMTKQEVKDEHKQQEGDPHVKARIRSLRQQRARKRMMAAVPKADVIVTNPTHYAVALKYDQDAMNAPMLIAKGVDLVAKRIRDVAQEHDIPLVENPPLARALYATVDLDREVPPEHYKAVAEVIGYVMRLKGKGGN